MDLGLKNRSVIVAASSDGIARAAAEKFAAEGARIAMCSRDESKLNAAADAIRKRYSVEVITAALDVTDEAAVHSFVERVGDKFGSVDVCVTNAGGPPAKMFLSTTTDEWHRAVELNFMSIVHFARAVVPWMQRQKWGRIVTITSVSVRQPVSDLIYSNAVRAGVVGLVKSLSNEFGKDGITVNNVAPGYTATQRLSSLLQKRASELGVSEDEYSIRLDILTDAAYTGSAYTGYGRAIAARDYEPAFTVALGLKDLSLTEQAAGAVGAALPTAPVLRQLFEATLADAALADQDWSAIAETIRSRSV